MDSTPEKGMVKSMASKKTLPSLETVEVLFDEVDEQYARFKKTRQKLSSLRRGSDSSLDVLPDLEVELFALKLKSEHAHEALEEFEEALSDEG